MIVELPDSSRPLCPNIKDPLHRFHTELIDEISRLAARNEDDEFLNPETEKIYAALAYGRFDGRMYLYKENVSPISLLRHGKSIQAYYFRCYTCNFTVAAQEGNW